MVSIFLTGPLRYAGLRARAGKRIGQTELWFILDVIHNEISHNHVWYIVPYPESIYSRSLKLNRSVCWSGNVRVCVYGWLKIFTKLYYSFLVVQFFLLFLCEARRQKFGARSHKVISLMQTCCMNWYRSLFFFFFLVDFILYIKLDFPFHVTCGP